MTKPRKTSIKESKKRSLPRESSDVQAAATFLVVEPNDSAFGSVPMETVGFRNVDGDEIVSTKQAREQLRGIMKALPEREMAKRGRPPKAEQGRLVRFQALLDQPTHELFTAVKKSLGSPTQADALRLSLKIAKWFLDRHKEGYRMLAEHNGQLREIDVIL